MKQYMQQAQARAQAKAEQRVNDLEEERLENERVREQIDELNEIEIEKKAAMQEQHRENVKQGMEERRQFEKLQKEYDKAYGFNDFPFTHGDEVERAQENATLEWRKELVEELKKKGQVQASKTVKENQDDHENQGALKEAPNEAELQAKASSLTEAKQNDNMLNLQTRSLVLKNQTKKDNVEFKNEKHEALYNRFIQETPFYAKKHKAVLARPQPNDINNADSVIRDARKRFEMDLMRSRQKEVEDEKELKALEEENNRFQMACDLKRQQEKHAIREILNEQI